MNLIFTMAGSYQKSVDENINVPKYLLPWSETTILGEIVSQISKNFRWKKLIGVMATSDHRWQPTVSSILNKAEADIVKVFGVTTDSQISTAKIALSNYFLESREKVVFANIDTILYYRDWKNISKKLDECDGYIDIFKSGSPNYSYILPNKGVVSDVFEKHIVSDHASSGLYAFSDSIDIYKYLKDDESFKYFSDTLSKYIKSGKIITHGELYKESETLVLGTPSEYFDNLIKYGSNL